MERPETSGREMERREFTILTARLQRVERRQRMTLIGWVLSMAVLVVLWAGVREAGSQSSVIRAREFDVVDSSGRNVLAVGIDTEGLAGLWIYDEQKKTRIALGFAGRGAAATAGITLYNKGAKLQLGFDNVDLPGIWYYDLQGTKRSVLGFGGTAPGLWFYDGAGTQTWTAP